MKRYINPNLCWSLELLSFFEINDFIEKLERNEIRLDLWLQKKEREIDEKIGKMKEMQRNRERCVYIEQRV